MFYKINCVLSNTMFHTDLALSYDFMKQYFIRYISSF